MKIENIFKFKEELSNLSIIEIRKPLIYKELTNLKILLDEIFSTIKTEGQLRINSSFDSEWRKEVLK